ncbi:CapA family protein [Geovibrio ferrireducens]|uniref:CapA family protein n=1 Tax=Geovibrio ferrireducens TaxID=46201 RepID=UPI0022469694|nr:CapA family protein [Geovibrio ferrireducens]
MSKIFLAGDLCLTEDITIDNDVAAKINSSEGFIANYESVFPPADALKRQDKNAILISSVSAVEGFLKDIKVSCVFGIGNNHIHDMGEEGVKETRKRLTAYEKVSVCGAGYKEALNKPLELNINQKKIYLLAVSSESYEVMSKPASDSFEGILSIETGLENLVSSLRQECDFLIIYAHIGKEYVNFPRTEIRQFAYRWIDTGADAVIGHHPHVIQGKEYYNGKPIYYSLGNFIFPDFNTKNGQRIKWKKENNYSIMLELEVNNGLNFVEHGLYFDTKSNRLSFSTEALDKLYTRSEQLNLEITPLKRYYGFWEKEYFKYMAGQYSFAAKVKRKFNKYIESVKRKVK